MPNLKSTRYVLQDHAEGQKVILGANWNTKSSPNKYFTLEIDGKKAIVNAKHLRSVIWLCSDPEERDNLIKNRMEQIHEVRRNVVVKASKDIRAGDFISFMVTFPYDEITLNNAKHDRMQKMRR